MKRKVNLVGTSTLTVSLPNSWARVNNISKGDEIHMQENSKGNLEISTQEKKVEKVASIDSKGLDLILNKLIAGKYKAGFTKILVNYSSPSELKIVQDLLYRTCPGFEILELTKDKITIELVARPESEEFEKVYRQIFNSLTLLFDDLRLSIEEKDFSDMKSCSLRHAIVNKYSDFCRRTLIITQNRFSMVGPLFAMIESLEKISDHLRAIAEDISENRLSLSKTALEMYDDTKAYFKDLKKLVFDYENSDMLEFVEKKKSFNKKYDESKFKGKEIMIFVYLKIILQLIYDTNGPIMILK